MSEQIDKTDGAGIESDIYEDAISELKQLFPNDKYTWSEIKDIVNAIPTDANSEVYYGSHKISMITNFGKGSYCSIVIAYDDIGFTIIDEELNNN